MFAIMGVTGNTGKAAAETLLAAGERVRVVVRRAEAGASWAARGAEVAVADIDDEASLVAAFAGARGVYALAPPDLASDDFIALGARRLGAAFAAARAAGVAHVVMLSSIGAHQPEGTGPVRSLHAAEALARTSGLAVTALRAAYFQENWASVLPVAREHGVLPSFLPADLALPMVATRDIGRAAARALVEPPTAPGLRVWAVQGPEAYTPRAIAATLAALLGRPVEVQELPLSAVAPTFASFGASAHMGELYAELYAAVATGHLAWEAGDLPVVGRDTPRDTFAALLGA